MATNNLARAPKSAAPAKTGKPKTGFVEYVPANPKKGEKQGHYRARLTLPDGGRPWIDFPAGPKSPKAEARARESVLAILEQVKEKGLTSADFRIRGQARKAQEKKGETVTAWFGRYFAWREAKPIGGESVSDSRGRYRKWIGPQIGELEMTAVTRDDLENLVAKLDTFVSEKKLSPKTALNVFGEVRAGFGVAANAKDRTLRVLKSNPAEGVPGPDKAPDRLKTFLRPAELHALLGCEDIPIGRRHTYACAAYTGLRQGELRALRVRDVDLEAMQIMVARTEKNGKTKARTKTGRARVVQVEPNLVPLLRVLIEGKDPATRLVHVNAHNRCSTSLRDDLRLAGCTREALFVDDELRQHFVFHGLRDTHLSHRAVRLDAPQTIQWTAGHASPLMTERYVAEARHAAGANFGEPLAPLPANLLRASEEDEESPDAEPSTEPDPTPPEESARESEVSPEKSPSRSIGYLGRLRAMRARLPKRAIALKTRTKARIRFPAPPPL